MTQLLLDSEKLADKIYSASNGDSLDSHQLNQLLGQVDYLLLEVMTLLNN